MRRRAILIASAACLTGGPALVFSQTHKLPRRVVILQPGSEAGYRNFHAVFRNALKDLGHVEGRDLSIEIRWGHDRFDRLATLAAEVVALNPDVIVTASSAGVAAVRKATSSIPIVFATAGNPVEQGFVSSLSRPGGNITGVIVYVDIIPKIVELAREALPAARRLALLLHEPDPASKLLLDAFEPNAQRFKFEPIAIRVSHLEDLDRAFRDLVRQRADALIAPTLIFLRSAHAQVVERALKARIPLLSTIYDYSDSGALLSYGSMTEENYRRAAGLVDKILRGASPAELPVEQPERFQLVVNRKTAKAVGVEVSRVTLVRADRVIE
jgi:putative ABC transport system substrate-binding protein